MKTKNLSLMCSLSGLFTLLCILVSKNSDFSVLGLTSEFVSGFFLGLSVVASIATIVIGVNVGVAAKRVDSRQG
ncbi:hypothetical protein ACO0K9_05525 [Undibacterium sp. Ji50W]|uniref:hypothetical protein n=1 Tax=Undibacterium sp. Ji50W TaxID=3413041 RepID=UPI003BEFBD46